MKSLFSTLAVNHRMLAFLPAAMCLFGTMTAQTVTVSTSSLTGWSIDGSSTLQIRTSATDADSDGSGMTPPYLEERVERVPEGKAYTLPASTWSYTVTGLTPNAIYKMSALVRAFNEHNGATPSGVCIYSSYSPEAKSIDILSGNGAGYETAYVDSNGKDKVATSAARYATLTVLGKTDAEGTLTIGVHVENGKVNWVAVKDITLSYVQVTDGDYVDLALPSGTLWATRNVGANYFCEYGNYYSWGETVSKETYFGDTYKYGNESNMTKYTAEGSSVLEADDDAATKVLGEHWKMPTLEQFRELVDTANTTISLQSGGIFITSKGNGNCIFLPAAGFYLHSSVDNAGQGGYYWTSTRGSQNKSCAAVLDFGSAHLNVYPGNNSYKSYFSNRFMGYSVRPVYVP